ncbi:MAG: hypothetical protein HO274_07895 [Ferrovum myxofaciens]|uniref:hypothetical protein n=1 Tax=Ferrovum myxofaciens TaxID=416213 RepID=UPI002352928A|nr:hypothetical protein [Ferrovum myxofaciens]QKE41238.1 MAG: hypothetical protein HO274_07895 [Ferrovum myxofaciens]
MRQGEFWGAAGLGEGAEGEVPEGAGAGIVGSEDGVGAGTVAETGVCPGGK